MSNRLFFMVIIAVLFVAGCVTMRTYTIEKPRKDTEISGNQGYISGSPSSEPKENKFGKTRKVSVLEIEIPPKQDKAAAPASGSKDKKTSIKDIEEEPLWVEEPVASMEEEDVDYRQEIDDSFESNDLEYYTIQKNDTLQKISYKFYGTTKKWNMLYEANRNVLKGPDKIYPGIKIIIP
ncbi:MAG: LysM peptidoglycan-binding domain-containing protein [Candidatus Omnitrophica bacterium]|nr:LysM peptidoglycan-binding domain-containing protein [Candidatus Omnitrophota bacterium]